MNTIGRYRIEGEIGRGAMGVVYRAQDPAIGRIVAIKTIRLTELADTAERAKLRDRLFREAQSAGILSHPGIVTIYDVSEEDDIAYIAMEYVEGPTLDRMMVSEPPDGKLVLSILSQTGAALDYAHKRGIIHRDIKPSNIMMHEGTTAKITDFGVAKIQSQQLTHAGVMVGTPNFMSPEQIRGQPVTGRSDQFSLGVIAYELLTGEKPFIAESMPALVFKIVQEDQAPVQSLNQTLGWAVDTVIRRAMAKNPDERFPSCSDFAFALENACRSSKGWQPLTSAALQDLPTVTGVPTPGPAPPPEFKPEPRREEDVDAIPVESSSDSVPRSLRIARMLAVIVLIAGLLYALFTGARQYLSPEPEVAATVVDETRETAQQRPSPTAPPESVAQMQLPGEGSRSSASAPVDEQPLNPPDAPPKPLPSGPIETRFVTNPPGAFLVIDGKSESSCVSPCSLVLANGRHTIAGTKAGFRRALKIFESPREPEIFLNLDATTGTVVLRSEPRGAAIYVNGQPRTERTPAVLTLPVGQYSINLVLNDQTETQQVEVKDSIITNVAVTFEGR